MLRIIYFLLFLILIEVTEELCHKVGKRPKETEQIDVSKLGGNPWHVALYLYKEKEFKLRCNGVIIKKYAVLTAASCVFEENPSFVRVVAGKLSPDHDDPDSNSQEIAVRSIVTKDTYLGEVTSYSENLAILELSSEFDFNSVIQPVCLDPKLDMTPIAEVSGWGLNGSTRTLYEGGFKTLDVANCRKQFPSIRFAPFINYDKFCLLATNGMMDTNSGAGVVSRVKDGMYYLQGVISQKIHAKFSVATLLVRHFDWVKSVLRTLETKKRCSFTNFSCADGSCINERLKCNGDMDCPDGLDEAPINCRSGAAPTSQNAKKRCVLPSQLGGVLYNINPCSKNCIRRPGDWLENGLKVKTKCGLGYTLSETAPEEVVCEDGTWFQAAPECLKLCPGLQQPNLVTTCTYGGEPVGNCSEYQRNNTKAKYKCAPHYKMLDPFSFSSTTRCLATGEWEESLPKCVPDCGVPSRYWEAEPQISFGTPVKEVGKYPWHIGIYKKTGTKFDQICGGSIITPILVLTAAHCMQSPTTYEPFLESDLLVAAGKIQRSLAAHEQFQQSKKVKEVIVKETYLKESFEDDIALMAVDSPFTLNDQVLPVCLDLTPNSIRPNAVGTVVGWGLTENRIHEEALKEAQLRVVPLLECRQKIPKFIRYLVHDKICGAYSNASGPQPGDSGGGFVFSKEGKYFIHGIVSLKPQNDTEYCAFTQVETHLDWLQLKMSKYRIKY